MSQLDSPVKQVKADNRSGIQCAKCGHTSQRGLSACERCGAHLYVCCHYCGHRNQRAETRCGECGERLHRSFLRRWWKKVMPKTTLVKPVHLLLLLATVYLAYRVVIRLSNTLQ